MSAVTQLLIYGIKFQVEGVHLSESLPIDFDLPCGSCRYNLRGLTLQSECPECGALVEVTWLRAESRDEKSVLSDPRLLQAGMQSATTSLACAFIMRALEHAFLASRADLARRSDGQSIGAREICQAVRDLAQEQAHRSGAAGKYLERIGITCSEDVGRIMWALAEHEMVQVEANDRQSDFDNLFTLETLFSDC